MHACNPDTWETEAGGLLVVQGWPGLHNTILFEQNKMEEEEEEENCQNSGCEIKGNFKKIEIERQTASE